MQRFYYKDDKGNYFNFKSEHNDLIAITEEEFNKATNLKPTEEQIQIRNKEKLISEKKKLLNKYREDVEQVDLFGLERVDYEEKKSLCRQLVLELRTLEKETQ